MHLVEREAVLGAEREQHRVVVGRRLELEVEVDTELLAQREPKGAIDSAPEGRMHDKLHAAGLVEEPLDDEAVGRGQITKHGQ